LAPIGFEKPSENAAGIRSKPAEETNPRSSSAVKGKSAEAQRNDTGLDEDKGRKPKRANVKSLVFPGNPASDRGERYVWNTLGGTSREGKRVGRGKAARTMYHTPRERPCSGGNCRHGRDFREQRESQKEPVRVNQGTRGRG